MRFDLPQLYGVENSTMEMRYFIYSTPLGKEKLVYMAV